MAKFPGVSSRGPGPSSEKYSPLKAYPCLISIKSPSLFVAHSDIEALQLLANNLLKANGLLEVSEEFFGEAVNLLGD